MTNTLPSSTSINRATTVLPTIEQIGEIVMSNPQVIPHEISSTALPANVSPNMGTVMTPMAMIQQALASGVTPETLDKLLSLQERWEAGQAKKAFNEAFAAFKSEAIIIVRNRKVDDGPLKGRRYSELVAFVEAATPALSKHGLSASWSISRDEKDWIEVTCTVEHVLGGNKKVSLGGPPDAGGAKNALQARISTVTYLERATFKAACGLAEQGDDNDGGSGAPELAQDITADQFRELRDLLEESASKEADMLAYVKAPNIEAMTLAQYARAKQAMVTRINQKKQKEAK